MEAFLIILSTSTPGVAYFWGKSLMNSASDLIAEMVLLRYSFIIVRSYKAEVLFYTNQPFTSVKSRLSKNLQVKSRVNASKYSRFTSLISSARTIPSSISPSDRLYLDPNVLPDLFLPAHQCAFSRYLKRFSVFGQSSPLKL